MADCAHAGLTQIPKSLPKDTDWLIMSKNNMSSLQCKEIKHFHSLSRLDLKDNKLEQLPEDFVEYLSKQYSLMSLDISNNKLKTIPRNVEKVKFLTKLSLAGNRFQCNCNNMWMKNWLINSREYVQNYNTVHCQLESGRRMPYVQLTDADLTCPSMFVYNTKITFIVFYQVHLTRTGKEFCYFEMICI